MKAPPSARAGSLRCTVIDLDEKKNRNGVAHFDAFVRQHTGEDAPRTATVSTVSDPPGFHFWYDGIVEWEGGDGTLSEGVQVKCRRGFVVMPPSTVGS